MNVVDRSSSRGLRAQGLIWRSWSSGCLAWALTLVALSPGARAASSQIAPPQVARVSAVAGSTRVPPPPPPAEQVVVDNGAVEVFIEAPGSLGPPQPGTIVEPRITFDALSVAGSADQLALEGERFWELEFMDVLTLQRETVDSTQFSVGAPQISGPDLAGVVTVRLLWLDVLTPSGIGPATVVLELRLEPNAQTAQFQVHVFPAGSPASPWTVLRGGVSFPLYQDPAYAGEYRLLSPVGDVIVDPLGTLDALPGDTYDLSNFSVSQAFGFYRDDGAGLWGARLDPSGLELRAVDFEANVLRQAVTVTQSSYRERVFLDGTLQDDPSTTANEDAVPVGSSEAHFTTGVTTFGVFQGDWWDLAALYRSYFAATDMAAAGPLAERTDLPDWVRDMDAVFVLNAGTATEISIGGAPPISLATHLLNWSLHHQVDPSRIAVFFFGLTWTAGPGASILASAIPQYQVAPASGNHDFAALFGQLEAIGFRVGVYFRDCQAVASNGDWAEWSQHGLVDPFGYTITLGTPTEVFTPNQAVLVCPSYPPFQQQLAAAAGALRQDHGVDLIYLDNFIPTAADADHSEVNGHAPGYGRYQIEGYLDSLRAILGEGLAVYTEAPQEFYVAAGFLAPFMDFTDLLHQDERATFVPFQAAVYHEFAVLGPARGETFVTAGFGLGDPTVNAFYPSITSPLPQVSALAQRSALHAYALALVNGSNLWIPEPSTLDSTLGWVHQYPQFTANVLKAPHEALEFFGRMVRYRGSPTASDPLHLGRRLRDLPLSLTKSGVQTLAGTVEVGLVGAVVQIGGGINGVEYNQRAPVVQGVWSDSSGAERLVVLVNFDTVALDGVVELRSDARHLDLPPGQVVAVDLRDELGQTLLGSPLLWNTSTVLAVPVPLPGHSIRSLVLSAPGG
jgi:hypothetical protein